MAPSDSLTGRYVNNVRKLYATHYKGEATTKVISLFSVFWLVSDMRYIKHGTFVQQWPVEEGRI